MDVFSFKPIHVIDIRFLKIALLCCTGMMCAFHFISTFFRFMLMTDVLGRGAFIVILSVLLWFGEEDYLRYRFRTQSLGQSMKNMLSNVLLVVSAIGGWFLALWLVQSVWNDFTLVDLAVSSLVIVFLMSGAVSFLLLSCLGKWIASDGMMMGEILTKTLNEMADSYRLDTQARETVRLNIFQQSDSLPEILRKMYAAADRPAYVRQVFSPLFENPSKKKNFLDMFFYNR